MRKLRPREHRLVTWAKKYHTAEMTRQAQALPLRRDMVTLLEFARDNKVIGTQSTGNMPLKTVREVTARFVEPPKLEHTIGDHVYKLRSEVDLWPLYFLHVLAEAGGLLVTAPARRWQLTPYGQSFLAIPPLLQVPVLLLVWWHQVNWLIAYPFVGMGEALPPSFQQTALARLRALPVGKTIPFEGFADDLIQRTGLVWTAPDSTFATMSLRGSIERMIVGILADFGAVEREYREEPLGQGTISKLDTFQITPFGQGLLEAVAGTGG